MQRLLSRRGFAVNELSGVIRPNLLGLFVALGLLGSFVTPILAQGATPTGAIPIRKPTTITEPGHYILVQNIMAKDTIVNVQASFVDLDLNGFTLDTSCDQCLVDTISATGDGIRIHGGAVRAFQLLGDYSFHSAVSIKGSDAVVEDCRIYGALVVDGDRYSIRRNNVGEANFSRAAVRAGSDGIVKSNIVRVNAEGRGIAVKDRVQILENQVHRFEFAGIQVGSHGRVVSNVVVGSGAGGFSELAGLNIEGDGNLILENAVYGGMPGIGIEGDYNHLEGNILSGAEGACILFNGDENVYRRNTCRGGANVLDNGTGNTSHGDNYASNQM
jgi:hypothetical protein